MSGPKVVRIVTREEIEAICRRHIATVAAAAREFTDRAKRCNKFDATIELALAQRLGSLEALFAREEWMAVQKQCPETIAFLRAEADRLERVATNEAAQARNRRRRTMDAARSITSSLEAGGAPVAPELKLAAEGRAASLEDADRAIAAGLAAIPGKGKSISDVGERDELARRLSKGETTRTVGELTAGHQTGSKEELRLDALLAELNVLGDAAAAFSQRADTIAREDDAARRLLLTNSLIMDAAAHVALVRKREAIDAELRQATASLEDVNTPEADALRGKINASVGRADEGAAKLLAAEAMTIVEAHFCALAAAARRKAVLSGLSSLGYEIRAGMSAAWERDSRIVVRKPGVSDYGVELGAPEDAARFQIRLVGSTTPAMPRDAQRDADQEVIWCSEFDRLRAELGAKGEDIVLETAVEAGKVALRNVQMPHISSEEAAIVAGSTVGRRAK